MNNKKLLLPIVTLLALSGCTNGETISYVDVVDLPSAVQYLSQIDNYTAKVSKGEETIFTSYVNKEYRYDETLEGGVLRKDGNIYPFSVKDGQVRNKAKLETSSLYGKDGAAISFDNVDYTLFSGQELSTTKKAICLPILDIAGYSSTAYIDLKEAAFKLENSDINKFTVKLTFHHFEAGKGEVLEENLLTITNVGNTKSDLIESFINNGALFNVDPKLQIIADKLKSKNYTRIQPLENGHPGIVELFNPLYYVRLATNEAIKQDEQYLALQESQLAILQPNKTLDCFVNLQGEKYKPMKYDDVYDFQYFGNYETPGELALITRENPGRPGFAQGAYVEVMRDIAKVWDFPSNLAFINHLEKVSVESKFGQFSLKDKDLIDDFLARFNLTGGFDQFGGVEEVDLSYNENSDTISLVVVTRMGNYTINFTDFGKTSFKPFEDILAIVNA